jgi:TLD
MKASKSAANGDGSLAKAGEGRPPIDKSTVRSSNGSSLTTSDIVVTDCTLRSGLRQSVLERSDHLTTAEQDFLHNLCIIGNDIEVQVAHEKLLDTDVFFPASRTSTESAAFRKSVMDDSETTGWASDTIHLNFEGDSIVYASDSIFHKSDGTLLDLQNASSDEFRTSELSHSFRTNGVGSERRLSRLEERKSGIAVHLWKAHESGLGISKQASRRSLFGRSSKTSSSGSNKSGCLLVDSGDIFRLPNAPKDVTTTSDGRRVSWHSGPAAMSKLLAQHATPSQRLKIMPVMRRMRSESEGTRKSVTFHKDVMKPQREAISERASSMPVVPLTKSLPRRSSSNSIPSIHHGNSVYSSSSIPSLHYGVPVMSFSSQHSISSIPSLRLANALRSNSATSFVSATSDITDSEYISPQETEEKKTDDADDILVDGKRSAAWKSNLLQERKDVGVQDALKILQSNDPDAPLQLDGLTVVPSSSSDHLMPQHPHDTRPVMMRKASMNMYQGEGIEVTEVESVDDSELLMLPAMADFLTVKSSSSFDDFALQMNSNRGKNSIFRRLLRRSLSDDSLGLFLGKPLLMENSNSIVTDLDESWNRSGIEDDEDYYDSWKVVEDEYENGYGGGGTLPFRILGTSADDVDSHPHVLSPPLMESLQAFLPVEKSNDNFWMKYSMVRDGASLYSFLQRARGSKYSILAIETVEGEVFGAFTAEAWRKSWNYFGNGETFLWKMRHSRREKCHSIIDQAHMESEIDVYPYIGVNNCIQLCTSDKIAIGGGTYESSPALDGSNPIHSEVQDKYKAHEWGFGLTIESDFLHGTASPCLTFGCPALSALHPNGSLFEIMNIELWTLTPCARVEDAEKLELGKLFLETHTKQ